MGENTSFCQASFFEYIPDIALIVKPDGQIVRPIQQPVLLMVTTGRALNMDIFKLTPAYLHGLLLESFKKAKRAERWSKSAAKP